VELAHRYFRNKLLPGSASDLLKEAVVVVAQNREKIVTPETVIRLAESQSKIPIQQAEGKEAEQLLNLEETIHKKLVNQENAVRAVSSALREYRSGLTRKGGPIASFLFVGPTGVGKTELSKIIASLQFGSKDMMQRFDMSEYQDKQSIFRFIGTPDGTRTGSLTDAVLARPYSLVLLDEFEKAHPDILNLFLQVFDDGRLTDSLGRTVNFENTIIIATSNAHSDLIKTRIEEGVAMTDISEEIKKKLTDYFRPELINRFSDIVAFRNLTRDEIKIIAGFLVKEVGDILESTHGITLGVSDEALSRIAELGYSPVFGARPLRQVISEKIRSALAEKLLRKELARGNSVTVALRENEFIFTVEG
jgi:ATP-dependent Clp protease ATP-binding subunit ClpE